MVKMVNIMLHMVLTIVKIFKKIDTAGEVNTTKKENVWQSSPPLHEYI